MEAASGTATAEGTTAGGARPPAGPGHARPGVKHWAVVAAGCAAVVAGALAAGPASGTPAPIRPAPRALPAAEVPDPAKAELPLDCGPFPVKISVHFGADLGDGKPGTVAAAHCDAENGTPPDAVFLLGPGPDGRPVVLATLLSEQENLTVSRLALRSDGVITGHAQGYSSDDVPRFSPDVSLDLTWTRQGARWTRTQTQAPPAQA
ncbi:hypothetical protein [Kitasatospora indigofera]|uniref:hypothetical protein n=1 Tax=Kitasatospora indigofera TaxID=67307 RepID=UPI0036CAA7FF